MRKLGLLFSAVVATALQASSAGAATFNWSYTDGGSHTGGGTLMANETAPNSGVFTIGSIAGTVEGLAITGGPVPTYALTGNTVYWSSTAPQFFNPSQPFFFTDYDGFAVSTASGFFAIYENTGNFDPNNDYACGGGSVPYCLIGPGDNNTDGLSDPRFALTNFQVDLVASTPIPGALPLFASGLGVLGFITHRRKRKQAVIAA